MTTLPLAVPLMLADDAILCHDKFGAPFEVRELRPSDRAELDSFYAAFEPKRAAQGLPPADPASTDRWLGSVLRHGLHLVAYREGELIGHAFVVPTARAGIGEYAVFLREDARGRGVGTELNRTVAELARRRGWQGLWLTVEPTNRAAIHSYEKAGFRFVPATIYSLETEMQLRL